MTAVFLATVAALASSVAALRNFASAFATLSGDTAPLNWDDLGCFNLSEDDKADVKMPVHSVHDFHCVNWRSFDSKCRSGLPFYRFPNTPGCVDCMDEDQCKLKCLSKGMDVAGLVGGSECRCGASLLNTPVWRTIIETDKVDGLQSVYYLLPPDHNQAAEASGKASRCHVRVFQYADKREVDGAPPRALVATDAIDEAYVQGVVSGTEDAVEIEDSAPEDFNKIHESINKRLSLWQRDVEANKLKRKSLVVATRPSSMTFVDRDVPQAVSCKNVKENQSVCWDQAVKDTNCGEYCSLKDFSNLRATWCTADRAQACPITCGKCQLHDRPEQSAAAVPLWPLTTISYVFDTENANMTPERKQTFRSALGFWSEKTCIKFQELDKPPLPGIAYVSVTVLTGATGQPSGCSCSPVGFPGAGEKTVVNLGSCADMSRVGSVVHELGHLFGLAHTQMRPDRDDYIRVLWENIQPKFKKNFAIEPYEFVGANGRYSPYDISSIMHYSRTQGMIPEVYDPIKNPGTFDILAGVPPGLVIGQRKALTDSDILSINTLYKCPQAMRSLSSNNSTASASTDSTTSSAGTAAGAIPATSGTAHVSPAVNPQANWRELIQSIAEAVDAIVEEESRAETNSLTETEADNLMLIAKIAETLFDKLEALEKSSSQSVLPK